MMDPESTIKKKLHLFIPGLAYASAEKAPLRMFLAAEVITITSSDGRVLECHRSLDRLFPRMNKYHNLVTLRYQLRDFLESDIIQVLSRLRAAGFPFDS
jgi:hypothetical protein